MASIKVTLLHCQKWLPKIKKTRNFCIPPPRQKIARASALAPQTMYGFEGTLSRDMIEQLSTFTYKIRILMINLFLMLCLTKCPQYNNYRIKQKDPEFSRNTLDYVISCLNHRGGDERSL